MKEVLENLFVGDEQDCRTVRATPEWAVVHACKHPCHHTKCGNPSAGHPDYLVYRDRNDLYLNMVDMERKQKHEFMEPMVAAALDFVDEQLDSTTVLIHCNKGQSRSPSVAMLYLAKRAAEVSDDGYRQATSDFRERYSQYNPGRGIQLYLQDYWHQLK